jgi:hypothetical protein
LLVGVAVGNFTTGEFYSGRDLKAKPLTLLVNMALIEN